MHAPEYYYSQIFYSLWHIHPPQVYELSMVSFVMLSIVISAKKVWLLYKDHRIWS